MLEQKKCELCGKLFQPAKKIRRFCSKVCSGKGARNPNQKSRKGILTRKMVTLFCQFCQQEFTIRASTHKYMPHKYCSNKCSLKANRSRSRSKFEIAVYQFLTSKYLDLDIKANDRTVLDGLEIDIWIPDIKLAIELNGPYHYKPILGTEYLYGVQERDRRKMELANKLDINLFVIPLGNCQPKELKEIQIQLAQLIDHLLTLRD